jgi:hypothetical protein
MDTGFFVIIGGPFFTTMKIPAALSGFLLAGLPLSAAVVTTVDNTSTPGDGEISLLEALTDVTDGETISFAIPGAGPHYILTPETGYPVVSKNGVTIDGYTQPGSSANTAGLREPNNSQIRIVLDSRTATPGARRTVLDYPGFGTSESCVIGLVDAHATTVRGLAFIGVAGSDSDSDPYVYNIGLVRECSGSKIQGCWFGLDPGVTSWDPGADGVVAGVHGARSAVAAFRGDGLDSIGLAFGNDGNSNGDRGEFNICMAQRLAVHLQTRAVTISGNWINVFPDGSLLNLEKQGLVLEDGSLEAIENGDPLGMRIGTDGNGSGDADEGNIIGPLVYDTVVECWGSNVGIVFAGNSVGVGLDNLPAFAQPNMSLFAIRKNSDLRVGSDMNGTGDADEANHIYGLGGAFISWHGNNNDGDGTAAVVNVRRNDLIDNYGGIPHDSSASISDARTYEEVMDDPSNPVVTLSPLSLPALLQGSVPLPKTGVDAPVVDVYLADAFGLYRTPPVPQGRSYLASYTVDGLDDLNPLPGLFTFDTLALNLTAAELDRVTITATYSLTNGRAVTTNFSSTLGTLTAPPVLDGFTIAQDPGGVQLQWTGGTAPFRVFTATSPAGPWSTLTTTSAQNFVTPLDGARRFYRLRDGLPPR